MNKNFINATIIVYEASVKICNWFDRRKRKEKIIENIGENEEGFNNFVEELKEDILKKNLDKYSDEKLKRILELTYYFKIYKNVNGIIDILEKLQEKKEGGK